MKKKKKNVAIELLELVSKKTFTATFMYIMMTIYKK